MFEMYRVKNGVIANAKNGTDWHLYFLLWGNGLCLFRLNLMSREVFDDDSVWIDVFEIAFLSLSMGLRYKERQIDT
jgi:hypothetical protein